MATLQPHAHVEKRILLNYAAEPDVIKLPEGFNPILFQEKALVGVCLIHLTQLRPFQAAPPIPAYSSWGVAYRVAVTDPEGQPAIFLPKRFTNSFAMATVSGIMFPEVQEHARIEVTDYLGSLKLRMLGKQDYANVEVEAGTPEWKSALFSTSGESSDFLRDTHLGYSVARDGQLEGAKMRMSPWNVSGVKLKSLSSSFIDSFADGTVQFDHALLVQDAEAVWETSPGQEKTLTRNPANRLDGRVVQPDVGPIQSPSQGLRPDPAAPAA